jgi:hypothetical protein
VVDYADTLSRLDIDSLKIQEGCISNVKSTMPIHTALIFKEKAKVKKQGLKENS